MNIGHVVFDSAKFLLPMDRPEGPAGVLSAVLDQTLQMYRVITRGAKEKKNFPVHLTRTVPRSNPSLPNVSSEKHLGITLKPKKFNWADEVEEAASLGDKAFPGHESQTSSISEDEEFPFCPSVPGFSMIRLNKISKDEIIASDAERPNEDKGVVVPSPGRAMEALDLDAVFGGEMTDLEEDSEELSAPPVRSNSAPTTFQGRDAGISNPTPVNLRQYIPNDIFEEANSLYNDLPPKYREHLKEDLAWSFSLHRVEWQYMCKASQMLRGQEAYKQPKAQKAVDEKEETFFHHLNFLGQRVFTKSATSPELSLWLAISSSRMSLFPSCTRRGVIASQATKLIDPIQYTGPLDILKLSGTKLRNAVTGFVEKVYYPNGTWRFEESEEDEIPPREIDENSVCWDNRNLEFRQMQKPYFMGPESFGDIVVNDGNASHPLAQTYTRALSRRAPSKLCFVENADPGMEVISSHLPPVLDQAQHREAPSPGTPRVNLSILESQAAEDVEDEDRDFYDESSAVERTDNNNEANIESAPTELETAVYQERGLPGCPDESIEKGDSTEEAALIPINGPKKAQEENISQRPPTVPPSQTPTTYIPPHHPRASPLINLPDLTEPTPLRPTHTHTHTHTNSPPPPPRPPQPQPNRDPLRRRVRDPAEGARWRWRRVRRVRGRDDSVWVRGLCARVGFSCGGEGRRGRKIGAERAWHGMA